jgi:hypothetical protein
MRGLYRQCFGQIVVDIQSALQRLEVPPNIRVVELEAALANEEFLRGTRGKNVVRIKAQTKHLPDPLAEVEDGLLTRLDDLCIEGVEERRIAWRVSVVDRGIAVGHGPGARDDRHAGTTYAHGAKDDVIVVAGEAEPGVDKAGVIARGVKACSGFVERDRQVASEVCVGEYP